MSLADALTPKVLCIDIETVPHLVWAFGLHDQNIGINQIAETGGVVCFAARWMHQTKVRFHADWVDGHDGMIDEAWKLLDQADAIVAYNNPFDVKHLNREFLLAGKPPPTPHKDIDLLRVARQRFRFASNKLDHVATELGLGSKIKHAGFDLWRGVMEGCPKAQRQFKRYNVQDVKLTCELYERLKPWIRNHPHLGLFGGDMDGCPTCGSTERTDAGTATTPTSKFPAYRCDGCGALYKIPRRIGDTTGTRSL